MFDDPLFYRFSIGKKYVERMAKTGRKENVFIPFAKSGEKSLPFF